MNPMEISVESLRSAIANCPYAERRRFRKRLKRLLKSREKPDSDRKLQQLHKQIRQTLAHKEAKQASLPNIDFNPGLPINDHLEEIASALQEHQVIIVCGETGSGKSTQLAKLCLQHGYGIDGVIGHTQPRRIAAKSIAARVADELHTRLGQTVGFKIRHTEITSPDTLIKVMTDGILLSEMQQDRNLDAYEVLIIDEAHERSLNIDFILGYLRYLLPRRPELRVIVTSATIDVQRFSEHFQGAPIIEVSGRSYPVEVRYRPIESADDYDDEIAKENTLLKAIAELSEDGRGDILIFLDGEREIHDMARFLRKQSLSDTDILPLYGRLSGNQQSKIFKPHKRRHIILATNIAETSLTIDKVHYVIDFGYARISRYSYRSKIQRLPIEKISQSSANQRMGRCGRTTDGICIRLYTQEDFESRAEFTEPEILRTNLAAVILQMKALSLGDLESFPFIEQPNKRFINDGMRLLHELGAIDRDGDLSKIGRQLARLPLDPRHGRMLIAANEWNCLTEVLIIVSAMSIQDPRERPVEEAQKADQAHEKFNHKQSDFLWFVNFWKFYHDKNQRLSQNQLQKLCRQNYVSYLRVREWQDVHRQLLDISSELKMQRNSSPADYNNIHCALLGGLLSHIAQRTEEKQYTGARGIKLNIFPGSSQFKSLPKWIMAAELGETSRLYARTVAIIDPKWLLHCANHLLQRDYFEPYWDEKKQEVMAYERVTLYGLVLVAKQTICYGKINPEEARRIFIQEALVNLKLNSKAEFYLHNNKVIDSLHKLEQKTRRPDILNDQALFDFYDRLLGGAVFSNQNLEHWRREVEKKDKNALFLDEDTIRRDLADEVSIEDYPSTINVNNIDLTLHYKFKPGAADDGISVDIPLQILNQVNAWQFDHVMPGMLEEKIICLIKSLPKKYRKQLVPVPEFARKCSQNITAGKMPLHINLAEYIFRTKGVQIPEVAWNVDQLPDHVQLNYRVLDCNGKYLAQARDLVVLRASLANKASSAFADNNVWPIERTEIKDWDFDELPGRVVIEKSNVKLIGFPALHDDGDSVSIKVFDSQSMAEQTHRNGIRRLCMLRLKKEIKYLRKNLSHLNEIGLYLAKINNLENLKADLIEFILNVVFIKDKHLSRTKRQFQEMFQSSLPSLMGEANVICDLTYEIAKKYNQIMTMVNTSPNSDKNIALDDIKNQLNDLIYSGFLKNTPLKWLKQYPRYFDAISKRLEKISHMPKKDQEKLAQFKPHWDTYKQLSKFNDQSDNVCAELEEMRWMLEEYKVSLFAQELKTIMPVSSKRIQEKMEDIRSDMVEVI